MAVPQRSFVKSATLGKVDRLPIATKRTRTPLYIYIRRAFVRFLNFFINKDWVLATIGTLNRMYPLIETVFVAYPAKEEYAYRFVHPNRRHLMRWKPCLAGLFLQNGRVGIITVISSSTPDFDQENQENLALLLKETDRIRTLIGAKHMTFAGTLPNILHRLGLVHETKEADVTASVVIKAEEKIRAMESYPKCPVVVFGAEGLIGSKLVESLSGNGRDVYGIDVGNKHEWPKRELQGEKAFVINVTKRWALSEYVSSFWPGIILINEVYPEPDGPELEALTQIGCKAYHVVGVRAFALPSLGGAYGGGGTMLRRDSHRCQ